LSSSTSYDFVIGWSTYLQNSLATSTVFCKVHLQAYRVIFGGSIPIGFTVRATVLNKSHEDFPHMLRIDNDALLVAWKNYGRNREFLGAYARLFGLADGTLAPQAHQVLLRTLD
jgi:hypothetical protein